MKYKISIQFSKEPNIDFFDNFNEVFDVIKKEFIFFNTTSLNDYAENSISSYVEIYFNSNSNNIQKKINEFFSSYNFIKNFNLIRQSIDIKEDEFLKISTQKIQNLVSDIDKIFYIRKDLQDFSKYINEEKKQDYLSLLKKLSLTKYNLKNEVIDFRLTSLKKEVSEIENNISEYCKAFGINLKFTQVIEDIQIDKIIFYKLKNSLISVLYNFVILEANRKDRNINFNDFEIILKISQEMNTIKINIFNKAIKQHSMFNEIIEKSSININEEFEMKEIQLNIINFKNTVNNLNGKIFIDENHFINCKIKLDFYNLNCLIVKKDKLFFAIELKSIINKLEFNSENILKLDNIFYYKIDNNFIPILDEYKNNNIVLIVKLKNQRYAFFVDEILYTEKIFVRPLTRKSDKYIGDCLLKDTKKALVLNMKSNNFEVNDEN